MAVAAALLLPLGFALSPDAAHAQSGGLEEYDAFGGRKSSSRSKSQGPANPAVASPVPTGSSDTQEVRTSADAERRVSDVISRAQQLLQSNAVPDEPPADAPLPEATAVSPTESTTYRDQKAAPPPPKIPPEPVIVDSEAIIRRETPRDPRFFKYRAWYKDHAVLSVVVNGSNEEHLFSTLEKLIELRDRYGVLLGEVLVVNGGMNTSPVDVNARSKGRVEGGQIKLPPSQFSRYKSALQLDPPRMENGLDVIQHLNLQYSPAWIVRYHGKNYVFEGNVDPLRLFARGGKFLRGDD